MTEILLLGAYEATTAFALTVKQSDGVTAALRKSFGLENRPDQIRRNDLYCAFVVPPFNEGQNQRRALFEAQSYMGGSPKTEDEIEQMVLLEFKDNWNNGKASVEIIKMVNYWLTALKAAPYLGDAANPPVHHSVTCFYEPGVWNYGDGDFWGIKFTYGIRLNP